MMLTYPGSSVACFFAALTPVPYGILVTARVDRNSPESVKIPIPWQHEVTVDPVGWRIVHHGAPRDAGGVSHFLYEWLDLIDEPAFPTGVRAQMDELWAAWHAYFNAGHKRLVIHASQCNPTGERYLDDEGRLQTLTLLNNLAQLYKGGLRGLPGNGRLEASHAGPPRGRNCLAHGYFPAIDEGPGPRLPESE